ncbi:MAG: Lrp/AsnC family transcriptional regulator [Erysipelotrichales bacterium]
MDKIDVTIISTIQENPKITMTELSKKINLSRSSIGERIDKLKNNGVIEGYQLIVNPYKIGYNLLCFLFISDMKIDYNQVIQNLKENNQVLEVHCLTGDDAYLVKMVSPNINELDKYLSKLMKFCKVETKIVLSTPISQRGLKPII